MSKTTAPAPQEIRDTLAALIGEGGLSPKTAEALGISPHAAERVNSPALGAHAGPIAAIRLACRSGGAGGQQYG